MPSFMFTKWLQDVFDAVVVIQIADDEKYMFKDKQFAEIYNLGFENAKDIIACGFNKDKTFIFSNRDYSRVSCYQTVVWDILKNTSQSAIQATFGIDPSMPAGTTLWPCYQTAAAFSNSFEQIFNKEQVRCLIVYGVDQDPYQRVARDVAPILGFYKPCGIMMQFLPALEGSSKMSSTNSNGHNKPITTIFMTDKEKEIYDKVKKYAFSGGKETVKEHKEKGADLSVDIPYMYLRFFEFDDVKLEKIGMAYSKGIMMTSEIKKILSDKLFELVENHKKNRAEITDEDVKYFYDLEKFV
jgi:tryptophanyl-tRNA synthetase